MWPPRPVPTLRPVPTPLSPRAPLCTRRPYPSTKAVTRQTRLTNSPRGRRPSPSTTACASHRRPPWNGTPLGGPSWGVWWRWSHLWSRCPICPPASIQSRCPTARKLRSPFCSPPCHHLLQHSAHIPGCRTPRFWTGPWICTSVRMEVLGWG